MQRWKPGSDLPESNQISLFDLPTSQAVNNSEALGGGSPWDIYQDYIDGKREIKEINAEYMEKYRQGRNIM